MYVQRVLVNYLPNFEVVDVERYVPTSRQILVKYRDHESGGAGENGGTPEASQRKYVFAKPSSSLSDIKP